MVTLEEAKTAKFFEHMTLTNSSKKPLRCRASGKCQLWKTRPTEFKLPVKHGLYNSFYITNENAADWKVTK